MLARERLKELFDVLTGAKVDVDDPRIQKAQRSNEIVRKLMLLIVPFFGAITPIFADDPATYVRYIGLASVLALTVLAGIALFGRPK